jgi:hypothetical protein
MSFLKFIIKKSINTKIALFDGNNIIGETYGSDIIEFKDLFTYNDSVIPHNLFY